MFNNAGYILTGFFESRTAEQQLCNLECNAISVTRITHHFVSRLIKDRKKGCIVFTSSAAAAIPNPFAVMYGSTKAFVSQFAACLAPEVAPRGIDVCAVHPSPVASNFYDKTHKIEGLQLAQRFAVHPDALPDEILRSIGPLVWRDIGGMAIIVRLCMHCTSYGFAAFGFACGAPFMGDYKKFDKDR